MSEAMSKMRLRLWLRLLRATRLFEMQVRDHLRTAHGTTLPRFDVMAALFRANHGLTMSELSRMLLVSNGNTTAVVDRLEKDGLVRRVPSESDRRTVHVALTPLGREQFGEQARTHEQLVDKLFASMNAGEVVKMEALIKHMMKQEDNA
ncbi:MAG: MarR family transcriptional regulator [Rhizobiaceae bacterium]